MWYKLGIENTHIHIIAFHSSISLSSDKFVGYYNNPNSSNIFFSLLKLSISTYDLRLLNGIQRYVIQV